ncbi:MAG: hypothetical protein ABJ263_01125 [Tateyamaria sp.]|uniref:hypothetical protein n=1 Tax=Tateyamaria sp. TaxID=1929288 RepID=UPI0032860F25
MNEKATTRELGRIFPLRGTREPVCLPHGSVVFYAIAEIFVLRALAARISNLQVGLQADMRQRNEKFDFEEVSMSVSGGSA